MKTIEIKCKGSEELDLEQIEAFQGNLKDLSKENYDRLRKQILELGFSAPIAVWKHEGHNYCLDGHQRVRVLTEMKRSEGYEIPKLPVVAVEAATEHEAKKKILALASQFGEVTKEGLFEFVSLNNIDLPTLEGFRLPEIDMPKFEAEFFDAPVKQEDVDAGELATGALAAKFLIPPFSVLNAREGWWQQRKAQWIALGIKSELGRGGGAASSELQGAGTLGCIPPNQNIILKRKGSYA